MGQDLHDLVYIQGGRRPPNLLLIRAQFKFRPCARIYLLDLLGEINILFMAAFGADDMAF